MGRHTLAARRSAQRAVVIGASAALVAVGLTTTAGGALAATTTCPGMTTACQSGVLVDDATVRAGAHAGTRYGAESKVLVKEGAADFQRTGLLRFDLAGVDIGAGDKAVLRLHFAAGPVTQLRVHRTASTWAESTVTGSSRPKVAGVTQWATVTTPAAGGWVTVDLTSLAAAVRQDGSRYLSLQLTAAGFTESPVAVSSRQAGTATSAQFLVAHTGAAPTAPVTPPTTGVVAVAPSADATIAGDKPTSALGTVSTLQVSGSAKESGRRAALLRFPITALPASAPVTLSLRGTHAESAETVTVSTTTGSWTESSVRWPTRPRTGTALSSRYVGGTGVHDYEFDVTAAVRSARSAGRTSVDLIVAAAGTSGDLSSFSARESGTNGPRLLGRAPNGNRGAVIQARRSPDQSAKPYLAQRVRDVRGYTPRTTAPATSPYGGVTTGARYAATGSFRSQKIGNRWWLIDPAGYPFYNVGMNSVRSPDGAATNGRSAFDLKAQSTLSRLGFTTTGAFSDVTAIRGWQDRTPYSTNVRMMQTFGKELGLTRQQHGHMAYRADSIPVFHPGFPAAADRIAAAVVGPTRNDPYVFGHFLDNELPLASDSLRQILAVPTTDKALGPNAREAWTFLRARHGAGARVTQVTQADEDAWLAKVMDRYYAVSAAAVRKHAPGQLVLGSRIHARGVAMPGIVAAAGRHNDVVSINYYGRFEPRQAEMDMWATASPKAPVFLSELYVKGVDAQRELGPGAGWIVPTQTDRGTWYQNTGLRILSHQHLVGWHWFNYQDAPGDSNKGVLSTTGAEFTAMTGQMAELNRNVFGLIAHLDATRGKR